MGRDMAVNRERAKPGFCEKGKGGWERRPREERKERKEQIDQGEKVGDWTTCGMSKGIR